MIAIILIILHTIGFFVYFTARKYTLFYYIIWSVFAPYISSIITINIDNSFIVDGQSNYFIALIFIINGIRYKAFYLSKTIIGLLVATICLLVFSAIINGVPFGFYISWAVSYILPIYFVASILSTIDLSYKDLNKFLLIMLAIQILIGIVQYHTGLFVNVVYALTNTSMLYENIFEGTFRGENDCAAFVCICFMILLISHRRGLFSSSKVFFCALAAIVYYAILISGVRTYLLLILIASTMIIYLSSKYKIITLAILTGILFVVSTFLIVSDYTSDRSGDTSAIERQINGMSSIANNDLDGSTLEYTFYMLDNHFNLLDIFGEGKLCTKRGYDRIKLKGKTEASVTDATLAVYLVEFGPILLFLILLYYYQVTCKQFVSNSKNRIYPLLIFIFYLIATVTDLGVFNVTNMTILAMFSYTQNKIHKEIYKIRN